LIRSILISSIVFFIISGCTGHSKKIFTSKKVSIDGREMLYGAIDREQLYFDYPDWKQIEEEYKPSSEITNKIKNRLDSLSIDIFFGTWCSDSKREVPAFFKIIDQFDFQSRIILNIWAVDRNKKLENGLAQKCNIEFVPTFIFYRSNQEIGRIIETPDGLLEEDILNIVHKPKE